MSAAIVSIGRFVLWALAATVGVVFLFLLYVLWHVEHKAVRT